MNKENIERIYLDRFAEVFGEFPQGKIRKSEPPDFLVVMPESVLGIEITRLFHKPAAGASPLKEQESLRATILRRTKENYDGLGLPPVHVSVSFNESARLRRTDLKPLAEKLVALAQKLLPEMNAYNEEEFDWENRDYFPEQINRMSVLRFKGLTKSFWGLAGGAFIPELSATAIQLEIAKKEAKISTYLKACSKVWLIICVDGDGVSSWFDISSDAVGATYHSRFDRIFWFSFQGKVHDLRITH